MERRRVLVDTSILIEHVRARDKEASHLFRLIPIVAVETCTVVAAELYYGARTLEAEEEARTLFDSFPVHPFTLNMAARVSRIVRELKRENKLQDLRDVMIAATALELNLPVATLNRAHFAPVAGLMLESLYTS